MMLADAPDIAVPEPVAALSTKRLLTMTWLEGRPILEIAQASQRARNRAAAALFQAWWRPFAHYGAIHGDPHLGNYAVRADGGINLLDFGCIRTFTPRFVEGVIGLYRALQRNDDTLAAASYRAWGFDRLTPPMVDALNLWARFIFTPLLDDRVRLVDDGVPAAEYGIRQANDVHAKLKALGGVRPPREFVFMDRAAIGPRRRPHPPGRQAELPRAVRGRDRGLRCRRACKAAARGVQESGRAAAGSRHERSEIVRLLGLFRCRNRACRRASLREIVRGISGDDELRAARRARTAWAAAGEHPAGIRPLPPASRCRHPLRQFYPNLNGGRRIEDEDPFPFFKDFVNTHLAALRPLIETRVTNTNEVGRSSALHAGFRAVAAEAGGPLNLIEIGPSAGLNLNWDKYRVRYRGDAESFDAGPPDSPLTIDCALHGDKLPPIGANALVATRVGLELNPVDLSNDAERDWLKALVWPDQVERFERLQKAHRTVSRPSGGHSRRRCAFAAAGSDSAGIPGRPAGLRLSHLCPLSDQRSAARGAGQHPGHDRLQAAGLAVELREDLALVGEAPLRLRRYARRHRKEARELASCHPHGACWNGAT